ncbi:MAG: hypothetical protein QXU53_07255 [Thermosphaera sp.]
MRINASTGEQSKIVLTDNLGIDHFILPVGDKIALAYSRFVSTAQRRDLNLTIIDPAGNEVLADIPIEATANHDEYPVLAYNPRTGTIAVAYFISLGTTRTIAVKLLDASTLSITASYQFPNATLDYSRISFNIAPLGSGFILVYPNETATPGEVDTVAVYVDGAGAQPITVDPTPGANETFGEVITMRAPNYVRTDTLYSPFTPLVIDENTVVFTGFTYNSNGTRSVFTLQAKMENGQPVISQVFHGLGHYPSIAQGSSTIALAYSAPGPGGYDAVVKILDKQTLQEIAWLNLSAIAGTAPLPEGFVKTAYSPSGYYLVAWSVLGPDSTYTIVAAGVKESPLAFTGTASIPTTAGFNATALRIGVDDSNGFAILYREYKIATNESDTYLYMGKIGVDIPPITETTTVTETTTTTHTTTVTATETTTVPTTTTYTTTETTTTTYTTTTTATVTTTVTTTVTETSTTTTTATVTETTTIPTTTTVTVTETTTSVIPTTTTVTETATQVVTTTQTTVIPTTTTLTQTQTSTVTSTITQTATITTEIQTTRTITETETTTQTTTKTETQTTSILETSSGVAAAAAALLAGVFVGWLLRRSR